MIRLEHAGYIKCVGCFRVNSTVKYLFCTFHTYLGGENEYILHIWMVIQHHIPASSCLVHGTFNNALSMLHVQSYDSH